MDNGHYTLVIEDAAWNTSDSFDFEIKNLDQFCQNLEARGIKLDRPYSKSASTSFGFAIMTDPWGTRVELTEGYEGLFPRSAWTDARQP